ncbi:L-ascorbate oxidase [Marchantia polymorpha subsp. ruderalis]|uniref:L-ascorbate oxidase n=2 Tax=Marchantia polymorpha TaxID=3197 RepID=A0A176VJ59_MARPO|nr:hypothetical protein AXG93_209s1300 [Marchantia polymorpha subsp. ruderalis]PTQ45955.1 hypothetical protein MARPO_0013s0154 [Marchantia polymorpha]BBN18889.1 hypothetical protein Mp_8g06360 [Marchantia polymorpha subsp. ruderalis]|eukprot:PTQ45955.1 hypothetical protein MARPO_0013s0154 [Marchantia polymorpha]
MILHPILGLAFFLLILSVTVQGAVIEFNWTVNYLRWAPDCVDKLVIAINEGFPGPTINVTEGDTIKVNVLNKLPTEGIVIHWHGMHQKGTPWADGTAFVSQCPIGPGEEFLYEFVAARVGTYFYHGHHGMQRAAGFYGALNVHPRNRTVEPFKYDKEYTILLNDWWHKSVHEQEYNLLADSFKWVGEPQSLLIGGRGAYNCSKVPNFPGASSDTGDFVKCNSSSPQCVPFSITVDPGKTYRLRISSVASLAALNFILEGHVMTVVEVDGHYVKPVVVDNLDVYSGESFSVLFTADQDPSRNYWAGVNVRARLPSTPTGVAVLSYNPNDPGMLPTTPRPVSPAWNDFALSMSKAKQYVAHPDFKEPLPQKATDRHLFLLNLQNTWKNGRRWSANNISFVPTSTPILAAYKYNLMGEAPASPPDSYPTDYNISAPPPFPEANEGHAAYEFNLGDVVDVIIQNANSLTASNSEIHPWHLHGHDFWLLGYGNGKFNVSTDYATMDTSQAPRRNTVPVFPWGWTVIRFVADNPGLWPFHCHIEPHLHMGMGVIFGEGLNQLPDMPKRTLGCGLTKDNSNIGI